MTKISREDLALMIATLGMYVGEFKNHTGYNDEATKLAEVRDSLMKKHDHQTEVEWFSKTYGLSEETVEEHLGKDGFICP